MTDDACCFEEPEEEGGWVYVDWGRPGFEPYLHLSFIDHTIGKQATLWLGADGNPVSPAEQHAQMKRPLELVKASEWFFAQRFPCYKRPRQEAPPTFGFFSAELYQIVPVRFMFGCVATACQRLAAAPAKMHITNRTAWRWAKCVIDRVTQGRVRKVQQTLAALQAAAAARVEGEPDIFHAAGTCNVDLVFYHLIADPDSAKRCNEASQWQENALHWAVKFSGQLEVCRWLMQCGANPYERDEVGYNSLDYAIMANRILPLCQLMLQCNSEAETFQKLHLLQRRREIEYMPNVDMLQFNSYDCEAGVSLAVRCLPKDLYHIHISAFNLSPPDIRVLQIVKDRGDPRTGMSIADIASNSQMPRDTVARLMEQLRNVGKVRSTHVCCFPASVRWSC
jgi:hypothetical protein